MKQKYQNMVMKGGELKYENIEELSYGLTEEARSTYRHFPDITSPFIDLEVANQLMQGAIDIHTHTGPQGFLPRFRDGNDIALAKEAAEMGMGAIVIKDMSCPTARSAYIEQIVIDEWAKEHNKESIRVIGGIVLNYPVGGLNPVAVELMAKVGGRFVWTPNIDSSHHYRMLGKPGGIEVVEGDHVVPELQEIFRIIVKYDLVLSVCHHTTRERFIIIDDAREAGVKRIEVVHVNQPLTKMSIDQMKMAAGKGAYLGLYANELHPPEFPKDETIEAIREVGADHFVLGTDLGHYRRVRPALGYRNFLVLLLEAGIPPTGIEKMARINPEKLIF